MHNSPKGHMPISEDEYDHRPTSYEPSSTMSKAELRKTHKPIMEKRRRARINHCLNEIKTLILDAMKKDPARHSKLEKADILEMAVKHLQNVQRQQLALAMATDPTVLRKFKAGFNECAEEVTRYISNLDGLDVGLQQNISQHLSKCISGIEQIVHLNFPGFGGVPFLSSSSNIFTPSVVTENQPQTTGDQNNNPSFQIPTNLQLIPSRLPSGELALLVPNSSTLPAFSNTHQESSRSSAFVAVIPSALHNLLQKSTSPTKLPPRLISPPQSPSSSSSDFNNTSAPSPHGFRPVYPSSVQRVHLNRILNEPAVETQHSVTSTSVSPEGSSVPQQTEVKCIRFPIQKTVNTIQSQKLVEPLSIITNYSERFRNAHVLEDSVHYEENYQRDLKRKSEPAFSSDLLAVAPTKISKTLHSIGAADYKYNKGCSDFTDPNVPNLELVLEDVKPIPTGMKSKQEFHKLSLPSSSQVGNNNVDTSNDMWRPW